MRLRVGFLGIKFAFRKFSFQFTLSVFILKLHHLKFKLTIINSSFYQKIFYKIINHLTKPKHEKRNHSLIDKKF